MRYECGVGSCRNPRAGIVTSDPNFDGTGAHYAVSVCGADKCRVAAMRKARSVKDTAVYLPDPMEGR